VICTFRVADYETRTDHRFTGVTMSGESNKKIWAALVAVQRWLVVDFIDKINHASAITTEDWKPFCDANQTLSDEQFKMDHHVFHLTRRALVESLHPKLAAFIGTTNCQIQARDKDPALQKQLLAQMGTEYNKLVRDFESDLHEIKGAIEIALQSAPRINMPSLQQVGGGIIISSPNASQVNSSINAAAGSTVNAPTAMKDHSTHITSTVTNSPGAIANVAQHLANVTNQISRQVENSSAGDDVKALMKQLIEQVTAITATEKPEKVQQLADDLKILGDELAKPQPRRKWYELSLEGIKEAAESVGEVGKPIVKTVMRLLPLLVG
jgi:hypothetical protein